MTEIKKNYTAFYSPSGTSNLRFKVKVSKERNNFGRRDCLITPVSGDGECWVSKDSLEDEQGTCLTDIKPTDRDDEDDDS